MIADQRANQKQGSNSLETLQVLFWGGRVDPKQARQELLIGERDHTHDGEAGGANPALSQPSAEPVSALHSALQVVAEESWEAVEVIHGGAHFPAQKVEFLLQLLGALTHRERRSPYQQANVRVFHAHSGKAIEPLHQLGVRSVQVVQYLRGQAILAETDSFQEIYSPGVVMDSPRGPDPLQSVCELFIDDFVRANRGTNVRGQ